MRLTTVWWGVGKCLSKCRGRCLVWKNHCHSRRLYGALLAWYQQLSINVLQATFFTRVKHISMAYFVQIDPAMNKCILVSMRDTTSKEKCELSCLPMTAFDGSFIQELRRKVYPVGCRVIKCSFVMFAHINVQSSLRWIYIITPFAVHLRKIYIHLRQQLKVYGKYTFISTSMNFINANELSITLFACVLTFNSINGWTIAPLDNRT